jgi:oligosaccharide repeat unit polymerase
MIALLVLCGCTALWMIWNKFNREFLNDWFSPFNLLFYFWVFPFLASFMWLSSLQKPLSLEATLVILSCTTVLVMTSIVPAFILRGHRLHVRQSPDLKALRASGTLVVIAFLTTLLALYWAEFRGQELPLLVYLAGDASSSTLHTFGKDSKLQVIAYGILVAMMFGFYCGLYSKKVMIKLMYMSMTAIVVLLAVLKASKSDIYAPMLMCCCLYYYRNRSEGIKLPKLWWLWLLLAISLLSFISTIRLGGVGREGGYASEIEFKYSDQLGPILTPVVATIYGYMALGFQNFSNVIARNDESLRLGTSLFRPVLSAFMQGETARSLEIPVSEWGVVSESANVGTYLTALYIEGHVATCLLGSFLYGLFVNGVYIRFRLNEGGMWMFVYVTLLFPWTWMFFTNAFSVLTIYTNVVYVIATFVILRASRGYRGRAV